MSNEARTIRPFLGLDRLEDAFAGAVLHFGPDTCLADSSIVLDTDPHSYLLRPAVLDWAEDDTAMQVFRDTLVNGVQDLEISLDAVSLLVVVQTSYLKDAHIAVVRSLDDLAELPRRCTLTEPTRSPAFKTWQSGCTVASYLLLNRSIERKPLRPWRKGTWLAAAHFSLRTDAGRSLFRPTPLTDEKRRQLDLPAKTMRYLDMGDHDPLARIEDQGDEPTFYVDEEVLAQLSASPRSSTTSTAMQLQLALDFIAAIVHSASRRLDEEPLAATSLEGSLLDSIVRLLAETHDSNSSQYLSVVDEVRRDPRKVIAKAEHSLSVLSAITGSLKGSER